MKLDAGNGIKQDREVLPFVQPVPVSSRQTRQCIRLACGKDEMSLYVVFLSQACLL